MDGINSIGNNLISIQLEQLMTIKKEVLHIQRISNFFSSSNKNPYFKTHQNIIKQTKAIIKNIKDLKDEVNLHDFGKIIPYESLVIYQNNNNNIEEILFSLKQVKEQISQYNESSFNQYMPKPYLGRRYSSKAVSTFIENVTTEILEKSNNEIFTSLLWDYSSGFESHFANDNSYCAIETSFYYYELPYFIPNLFHELNHILLKPKSIDTLYCTLHQKYIHTIKTLNKDQFNIELNEGLAEEIVSDIFAYDLLGYSYVFSLFYSIVSDGMPSLFYNPDSKRADHFINYNSPDMDDPRHKNAVQRVIEVQLRLSIIIEYALNGNIQNANIKKELEYIKEFLGYIYCNPVKNSSLSLSGIYSKKSKNKKENFIAFRTGFDYIRDNLLRQTNGHEGGKLSLEMNYNKIFSDIWEQKLSSKDYILHRNILRKGILEQIFSDHDEKESMQFKPAELTFFKFNTFSDNAKTEIDKYFVDFTGYNAKDTKDYIQFECFGIYNNLAIRDKTEHVPKEKVEFFLDKCDNFETNFYTYKIAMTKLYSRDKNLTPENAFGAVIQLQLKDQEQQTIVEGYNKIRKTLVDEKSFHYDIYKVLGPGDYIVLLKNSRLSKIFEIKKVFLNDQDNIFRRSFTNIFSMNENSIPSEKDSKNKILVSKIRLKFSVMLDDLKKREIIFEEKNMGILQDYYSDIFCIPGSVDIEIQWKINDYSIVKKVLKNISEVISDVQTEYIKILEPLADSNKQPTI